MASEFFNFKKYECPYLLIRTKRQNLITLSIANKARF